MQGCAAGRGACATSSRFLPSACTLPSACPRSSWRHSAVAKQHASDHAARQRQPGSCTNNSAASSPDTQRPAPRPAVHAASREAPISGSAPRTVDRLVYPCFWLPVRPEVVQRHPSIIPTRMHRLSSELRSESGLGPISTGLSDRLGTRGVLGFLPLLNCPLLILLPRGPGRLACLVLS